MGMPLVKWDSMDDDFQAHRNQMRRDGLCAFGWIVPDADGYGMAVACVKKVHHASDHRAWGGHTLANTGKTVKRSNKS